MISLRVRLLIASIGLILVALIITGVLAVVLVERLEVTNTQNQLDGYVTTVKAQVLAADAAARNPKSSGCTGVSQKRYYCQLNSRLANIPLSGDDQLLVLSGNLTVLWSSQGTLYATEPLPPGTLDFAHRKREGTMDVFAGTGPIAGQSDLYAAAPINGGQAKWVILTLPVSTVYAQATRIVVTPILEAAAVGLVLAIAVSLLLSRALTRPLAELAKAAGDIAQGNYGRRAKVEGPREVSVVTEAFNRMAEAVETSRAQQRNFLADVSHELKTPLTSLIGFSQAMTDGSLPEGDAQRRAAAIVNEEAHRVLHLSQALLDLARAESGQIEYHVGPVDLGAILQQSIAIVQPLAASRGIHFELRLTPWLPPVAADHDRLVQVVENLIDNAVNYAPGGACVEIAAEASREHVRVDVANPIGEHRPDLGRIFDRFYRADHARSSTRRGAGLGLAI
ncbi:MAG: histidine kinase dimerization/phospho-acceptor domain-containing protein, partial [Candidatus Dormibacteraceae bacterium]